jgi:hypothetical protein
MGPGIECKDYRKEIANSNIAAIVAQKEDKKRIAEVSVMYLYHDYRYVIVSTKRDRHTRFKCTEIGLFRAPDLIHGLTDKHN